MKRLIAFTHILIALCASVILAACSGSEDSPPYYPPETSRTVLVYMVATNNLGSRGYDSKDIEEMKRGIALMDSYGTKSRLLIYHAPYYGSPQLKEIMADGTEKILETFTDGQGEYSVSVSRMRTVLDMMRSHAPADSYGMVMWSHGTGWLDDGSNAAESATVQPQSFGWDRDDVKMSIPDLGQALNGQNLDFIYFDCCLMGTVEIMYQLRNAADVIVASGTELPLEGMPYDANVPFFFSEEADLVQAAYNTYSYYCTPAASTNSCTIAVINTARLPALASATRAIMSTGAIPSADYDPVPYFRRSVVPAGAYDMADYIRALDVPAQLLAEWDKAFAATVKAAYATKKSYNLDMTKHTGLGINMINDAGLRNSSWGYTVLDWYRDVASYHPNVTNTTTPTEK
ncbi:MAG: clostripain-related cysteine peptidase [Muribaculaceae bacterium]|nr:clostripain-related cysteine peptidase [Muribaculaceae bacterium]